MTYFLLVYDKRREVLMQSLEYPIERRADALGDRRALQRKYFNVPEVEVVLLGAERFEDLRKTHSRYFKTRVELAAAATS